MQCGQATLASKLQASEGVVMSNSIEGLLEINEILLSLDKRKFDIKSLVVAYELDGNESRTYIAFSNYVAAVGLATICQNMLLEADDSEDDGS